MSEMTPVEKVKALRDLTGIGMERCKVALSACRWNSALAYDWLKADWMRDSKAKLEIEEKASKIGENNEQ